MRRLRGSGGQGGGRGLRFLQSAFGAGEQRGPARIGAQSVGVDQEQHLQLIAAGFATAEHHAFQAQDLVAVQAPGRPHFEDQIARQHVFRFPYRYLATYRKKLNQFRLGRGMLDRALESVTGEKVSKDGRLPEAARCCRNAAWVERALLHRTRFPKPYSPAPPRKAG